LLLYDLSRGEGFLETYFEYFVRCGWMFLIWPVLDDGGTKMSPRMSPRHARSVRFGLRFTIGFPDAVLLS
jgi:hypothetical protein